MVVSVLVVVEGLDWPAELRRIPVVVLTSSQAQEDVVKSYELSANAYLTKPVDPDAFTETARTFERFWLSIVRLSDKGR